MSEPTEVNPHGIAGQRLAGFFVPLVCVECRLLDTGAWDVQDTDDARATPSCAVGLLFPTRTGQCACQEEEA